MSAMLVVGKVMSCITRDVKLRNGESFKEYRIFVVNGNTKPIEVKSNLGPRPLGETVKIPVWIKTWTSKAGNFGWEIRESRPQESKAA